MKSLRMAYGNAHRMMHDIPRLLRAPFLQNFAPT